MYLTTYQYSGSSVENMCTMLLILNIEANVQSQVMDKILFICDFLAANTNS